MRPVLYCVLLPAVLLLLAGCRVEPDPPPRTPPRPALQLMEDLKAARAQARQTGKPLLVLNILGDHKKHC